MKELEPEFDAETPEEEKNENSKAETDINDKEEKPVILLVDDNQEMLKYLKNALINQYQVIIANNGKIAIEIMKNQEVDIVLSDVMMPEINGLKLCEMIKRNWQPCHIPVILLSAKSSLDDQTSGIELGADDYMTKPFRPLELVARVKSQLRRYKKYNPAQAEAEAGDVMTHAGLEMNVKAHQCLLDGKSLTLTPTEFSILQILLESKGTVVSAEELFYRIWADEYYSKTNNTITSHIRHLREKLNDTMDNPKYIRTIWGVGYKIED